MLRDKLNFAISSFSSTRTTPGCTLIHLADELMNLVKYQLVLLEEFLQNGLYLFIYGE